MSPEPFPQPPPSPATPGPKQGKAFVSIVGQILRGFGWAVFGCWVLFMVLQILSAFLPRHASETARKAQAKSDCAQICTAINAYHTEYGHYPLGAQGESAGDGHPDILFGGASGNSNTAVFDILRNIDSTGKTPAGQPNKDNPRAIVFFDGKTASDPSAPRAGFVPEGAKKGTVGAYMDPWGYEYGIIMDAGNKNQITNLPYADFQGPANGPHVPVAVFSLGKDGVVGSKSTNYRYRLGDTFSDDIISWQ